MIFILAPLFCLQPLNRHYKDSKDYKDIVANLQDYSKLEIRNEKGIADINWNT